ncbi:copper resistance protein B [Asticcacaulis sp. AND118]|uniref:copper resistance protein B n=1 Tax=Asticcacaulis sp. AND118 TaxID=2840468 RepID=UPI001CFF9310|nr:copper resistance protein B [Asticcacaulis sp. AND118]UDF04066.1 copper resistance protein B [Asticcacaulis sp. AND118]
MRLYSLLALGTALALTTPAYAQMAGHGQHGTHHDATKPEKAEATKPKPAATCSAEHAAMGHCTVEPSPDATEAKTEKVAPSTGCSAEHAAMGHCVLAAPVESPNELAPHDAGAADSNCAPEHEAMGHCTSKPPRTSPMEMPTNHGSGGTALPAGNAPAPAPSPATYADSYWGADAMKPVRDGMMKEHGGMSYSQVMIDTAEAQFRDGSDGYALEGEGWFGGDIHRLTLKASLEGVRGEGLEAAEVQALYSRAIGPYFNLQAGVRHDVRPRPSKTYATVGFEGLAPYWFEVEGAAFLSEDGDLSARLEGYYDQRITQKLILQPRAEVNFSAEDLPLEHMGAGLVSSEIGLRLRYEIKREFAPYIGVTWEQKYGDTADYARAAGEHTSSTSFVVGIRAWF